MILFRDKSVMRISLVTESTQHIPGDPRGSLWFLLLPGPHCLKTLELLLVVISLRRNTLHKYHSGSTGGLHPGPSLPVTSTILHS